MSTKAILRPVGRWLGAGVGLAAASYAAYVGYAWLRYGEATAATRPEEQDALMDRFIPKYEIAERHQIRVDAPADITFEAATETNLQQSPIIRAIFKAREWIMRSHPAGRPDSASFIAQMRGIGWGVLAEVPGREIVMGAVTQPWMADVVFRPLPPEEFAMFDDPGYVKIVWTLRADPVGSTRSVFHTETRAVATDGMARAKFRRYWSLLSPGIILIRWASLRPLKADAERRAKGRTYVDSRWTFRQPSSSFVADSSREDRRGRARSGAWADL
jgi:hypothetical protein